MATTEQKLNEGYFKMLSGLQSWGFLNFFFVWFLMYIHNQIHLKLSFQTAIWILPLHLSWKGLKIPGCFPFPYIFAQVMTNI